MIEAFCIVLLAFSIMVGLGLTLGISAAIAFKSVFFEEEEP